MAFKIYTKTGDKGETGLFGGKRLPKHHLRIEAYGTVDELNAHCGLLNDSVDNEEIKAWLFRIQDRLFVLGSNLAVDPSKEMKVPQITDNDVTFLEKAIDKMDETLPVLKTFVLPGGHPIVSQAHICRCVCRRAERRTVELSYSEEVKPILVQYLNRLSDFYFALGRYLCMELGADEIPWLPES